MLKMLEQCEEHEKYNEYKERKTKGGWLGNPFNISNSYKGKPTYDKQKAHDKHLGNGPLQSCINS